jgi:hypothetical protein
VLEDACMVSGAYPNPNPNPRLHGEWGLRSVERGGRWAGGVWGWRKSVEERCLVEGRSIASPLRHRAVAPLLVFVLLCAYAVRSLPESSQH